MDLIEADGSVNGVSSSSWAQAWLCGVDKNSTWHSVEGCSNRAWKSIDDAEGPHRVLYWPRLVESCGFRGFPCCCLFQVSDWVDMLEREHDFMT